MRYNEYCQYFMTVKKIVNKYGADALHITKQFEWFLRCFHNDHKSHRKVRKSKSADKIRKADCQRRRTFQGLANTARAALYHYETNVMKAAERLKIVFDTYGNLATLPINEATSGMTNLVQELSGTYAADVRVVGLQGWVAQLKANNIAFDTLILSRYAEDAARKSLKTNQTRGETVNAYREIVERINALIRIEGATAYAGFVSKMNALTEAYNHTIAQRAGKAKTKKETLEEEKETPPPAPDM